MHQFIIITPIFDKSAMIWKLPQLKINFPQFYQFDIVIVIAVFKENVLLERDFRVNLLL